MKICSVCKSANIKEVEIVTRGAFTVIELTKKAVIMPKSSIIEKKLCLDCGHIDLYAENFQKFK
ncbi:hypothetical protein H7E67_09630 [Clostridium gasigenes]|uniref:hypothetical protein n=1 Tax=Clostridium gasigenes TaxID=94869 RepID=UPI0016286D37|nr:hypothetical protein [Clostridium gasigenes]MBB6623690.1 hypothetical protein [Clostridium gasigenes]MBU3088822.1 hypothetical protein [Clostridium gasigenes]